jgi:carboxypeptidase family protein
VKGSLRLPLGSAFLVLALAGPALANGTISGKVTFPDAFVEGSKVIATSAKYDVYRVDVADDGTYQLDDVVPGTYIISAIAGGLATPDIKDVAVADGKTVTQDITLKVADPFPVVKSPQAISLDSDIDSADFADAPEIVVNSGKNLGVGPTEEWAKDGGPNNVSGRFRLKYSDAGLHLAADVTFKPPLVNNQKDDNLWNGNALEFDLQNDPYDVTRTDKNADHDWQVVVGLGETADWWLHGSVNARPGTPVTAHIKRVQKEVKDGVGGEKFRLDMPWSIFLQGDATGKPITVPADNSLGAIDIVLDSVDPSADRAEAVRKYQIQWSGFGNSHWNASSLVPVKFTPQATAGQ